MLEAMTASQDYRQEKLPRVINTSMETMVSVVFQIYSGIPLLIIHTNQCPYIRKIHGKGRQGRPMITRKNPS